MGAASDLFKAAGTNTVHTIMPFSSIHNMRTFRQSAIATDGVWRHLGPTEIGDIVYETHMEGIPGGCDDINDKIKTECAQENGKNLDDHTIIISALTTN